MSWDTLYLIARSWGLTPSEFWDMTLPEWYLEYWDRSPRVQGQDYAGNLTRGDLDDIKEWMN